MTKGELIAIVATIIAWVILGCAMVIAMIPDSRARRKYNEEFLFRAKFTHAGGLNLPIDVKCNVICLKRHIVIEANGQEFFLPVEKIVDVSIMKKKDMQRMYVWFSTSADMKIVRKDRFLIFTYIPDQDSNVEAQYIIFKVTGKSKEASKFTRRFQYLKREPKVQIDL